jgi:hypothetical protein
MQDNTELQHTNAWMKKTIIHPQWIKTPASILILFYMFAIFNQMYDYKKNKEEWTSILNAFATAACDPLVNHLT